MNAATMEGTPSMETGARDLVDEVERILSRRLGWSAVGIALAADAARLALIDPDGRAELLPRTDDLQDMVDAAGALSAAWLNELPRETRRAIGASIAAGATLHLIAQRDRTLFLMLERDGARVEIARCHISPLH